MCLEGLMDESLMFDLEHQMKGQVRMEEDEEGGEVSSMAEQGGQEARSRGWWCLEVRG